MRIRPEGAIAVNPAVARFVDTRRDVVDVADTDFTAVSAVVVSAEDLENGVVARLQTSGFEQPVFVVAGPDDAIDLGAHRIAGVLSRENQNAEFFGRMVETAASDYDEKVLPPFFGALTRYERRGYSAFDCPGHQGGQFFMRHPSCSTPPGWGTSSSSR
jgi:ornithine decarboxylase